MGASDVTFQTGLGAWESVQRPCRGGQKGGRSRELREECRRGAGGCYAWSRSLGRQGQVTPIKSHRPYICIYAGFTVSIASRRIMYLHCTTAARKNMHIWMHASSLET